MVNYRRTLLGLSTLAICVLACTVSRSVAQDQDDPPSRAARLGHIEGSVSFEPAGESEWVEAVSNRPMTTDDKLWADRDSRATVEFGAASIYLNSNTGISLLNLDDRTVQVQLSAGTIDVRVRRTERDNVLEIDTPNQAFSIFQPGRYRLEASENGDYTVVTVREGDGESTGNGQTYAVHAGQRATFRGTTQLSAELEQIAPPDDFDSWSDGRDRRFDDSRSARYCSRDMVGYEDLDEYGDWQPNSDYGAVWYPRVEAGWAPYRTGHWAWIDPWGWTWVDEAPWGYAPFHYGRWAFFGARWGWVPGPVAVAPVYAPALVVFVGGGPGFGGNVGWFPLGPREVYVPAYRVSPAYVNRVNITNTTVNQTTITNVYNTTIIQNNTTVNRVTYVNRNVNGAVTAVPQRAFASAQPVNRMAVPVNARELASAPVGVRVPVAPARESVLGVHANTAGRVAAPPQAVASRQVIARTQPPPRPPSFAARQQVLAQHPGVPVPRPELQKLRPANAPAAQAPVRVVQPTRAVAPPETRTANQPATAAQPNQPGRPGNPPTANERPGMNTPGQPNRPEPNRPSVPGNQPQPGNRPFQPPTRNDRAPAEQPNSPNEPPNRAQPSEPQRPANRPFEPPSQNDRPSAQPNNPPNRPQPNQPESRPETNRPSAPPARNDRPPSAQPNNPPERPQMNTPPRDNRSQPDRPQNNRPETDRPPDSAPRPSPNTRPEQTQPPQNRPEAPRNEPPRSNPPPSERQQQRTAPEARPNPQSDRPPARQQPEEKKKPEDQKNPPGRG